MLVLSYITLALAAVCVAYPTRHYKLLLGELESAPSSAQEWSRRGQTNEDGGTSKKIQDSATSASESKGIDGPTKGINVVDNVEKSGKAVFNELFGTMNGGVGDRGVLGWFGL